MDKQNPSPTTKRPRPKDKDKITMHLGICSTSVLQLEGTCARLGRLDWPRQESHTFFWPSFLLQLPCFPSPAFCMAPMSSCCIGPLFGSRRRAEGMQSNLRHPLLTQAFEPQAEQFPLPAKDACRYVPRPSTLRPLVRQSRVQRRPVVFAVARLDFAALFLAP